MQPNRLTIHTQQTDKEEKTNISIIHKIHIKLNILHQLKQSSTLFVVQKSVNKL